MVSTKNKTKWDDECFNQLDGRILSQCICIWNHRDVHVNILQSLFVNYTLVKLKEKSFFFIVASHCLLGSSWAIRDKLHQINSAWRYRQGGNTFYMYLNKKLTLNHVSFSYLDKLLRWTRQIEKSSHCNALSYQVASKAITSNIE